MTFPQAIVVAIASNLGSFVIFIIIKSSKTDSRVNNVGTRVINLEKKTSRHEDELKRLTKQFAALTGVANGVDFRKGKGAGQ